LKGWAIMPSLFALLNLFVDIGDGFL
jgi:hypothetical protein